MTDYTVQHGGSGEIVGTTGGCTEVQYVTKPPVDLTPLGFVGIFFAFALVAVVALNRYWRWAELATDTAADMVKAGVHADDARAAAWGASPGCVTFSGKAVDYHLGRPQ